MVNCVHGNNGLYNETQNKPINKLCLKLRLEQWMSGVVTALFEWIMDQYLTNKHLRCEYISDKSDSLTYFNTNLNFL
jgi:hypothetical protein